jgi:uncharacterized membrane protein YhhN
MQRMTAQLPFFVSSALVAVALFIYGVLLDDFVLRISVKAFPVVAMMVFVASRKTRYAKGILVGLAFCLVGDLLLEFRQRFFLPGMIAFLLGHVAYAVAFVRRTRIAALHLALPFAVWIGWALTTIWSGLGAMQIPVAAYTLAILAMMWRAAAVVHSIEKRSIWDWSLLIGAATFAFSDTLIALDRFGEPIDGVRIPIIVTYWVAQLLITASAMGASDE